MGKLNISSSIRTITSSSPSTVKVCSKIKTTNIYLFLSPQNLQLVRENRQILKDCVDEAFNMRSIPFALVFALGAHKAIQKGFVRPSRIFGSFPLMIGSSMLGCFVGLYSYRNKCAEKFQNYYDSKFGDFLRLNRNGQSLYGSTIGAEGEDVKKFMQVSELNRKEIINGK